MCDFDRSERVGIDQALFEPARAMERRLFGQAAPRSAWDVFFGRAGGAIAFADLERMRASYARAALFSNAAAGFRRSPQRLPLRCEGLADSGELAAGVPGPD